MLRCKKPFALQFFLQLFKLAQQVALTGIAHAFNNELIFAFGLVQADAAPGQDLHTVFNAQGRSQHSGAEHGAFDLRSFVFQ